MTSLIELRDEVNLEIQTNPGYKISSSTLIDKNINRALKRIQRDFNNQMPFQKSTYTFQTSGDVKAYALPNDFAQLTSPVFVQVGDYMASPTVEEVVEPQYINLSASGLSTSFYTKYDNGWQIVFAPQPTGNKTVKLNYQKTLPTITEQVNSPLPEYFDELIVMYAVYLTMRRIRGGEGKAADYYNEYIDLLPGVRQQVNNTNPQANHWGSQHFSVRNFNAANPFDRYA